MKIAHVQHPFLPGYGYQENHLPAKQAELGHEVRLFTSTDIPEKFSDDIEKDRFKTVSFNQNSVKIKRLTSWFKINEVEDVALRGIYKELKEFRPDIVHTHNLISPRTIQSYLYSITQDSNLVIDVHIDNGNFNLDSHSKELLFKLYDCTVNQLIGAEASKIIAVNKHAERFLQELDTIPDGKIKFLPLGVDRTDFAPVKGSTLDIRSSLNISDESLLLITAGNIEPSKQVETLLKALAQLDFDVELLIVGGIEPEYEKRIRRVSEDLGILEEITITGFVDHASLSDYLNSADIGVWPGKLGITSVEAIGVGLPIIVPQEDATRFFVSNNNGFVFQSQNEDDLAVKIQRYYKNKELLATHSSNSIELAEEQLYWESIAKECINIYNNE